MAMMRATFKHFREEAKMVIEYPCHLSHEDLDIWDDEWDLIELIDITPPAPKEKTTVSVEDLNNL